MSIMRNLATEFSTVKGLTTYRGAYRRIDEATKVMGGEAARFGFLWIVIQRPDNKFVPIAILNDSNRYLALFLANRGICVTTP